MKVEHYDEKFPFIIIENFYSLDEINLVWEELDFLCYPFKLDPPTKTLAAKNKGTNLKQNEGVFLEKIYTDKNISNIIQLNDKIIDNQKQIIQEHPSWFFKNILKVESFSESNLISYYENACYYGKHKDASFFTFLRWVYKNPKSFIGGNLIFDDYDLEIEIKNNMGIIFPSSISHSVTEVQMKSNDMHKKMGRFCISTFYFLEKKVFHDKIDEVNFLQDKDKKNLQFI